MPSRAGDPLIRPVVSTVVLLGACTGRRHGRLVVPGRRRGRHRGLLGGGPGGSCSRTHTLGRHDLPRCLTHPYGDSLWATIQVTLYCRRPDSDGDFAPAQRLSGQDGGT